MMMLNGFGGDGNGPDGSAGTARLREQGEKMKRGIIRGGLLLVIVILLSGSMGTVGAGERGVLLTFGAVSDRVFGEGLYFKIPFIQRVVKMDVRVQKEQTEASAASRDLQTVHSVVALNFNIKPDMVANIYQTVGIDFKERLIDPALQEAVKASTARYTAEELIAKREQVREDVKTLLRDKLGPLGIVIDEFNIVNFDFSQSFNAAIEAKVTAEQNALAAKNKLAQIEFEAQQAVASARGRAEAIKIEANALQSNPAILQLRAIEKWNGVLPQVTGQGGMPLINLPAVH